MGKISECNCEGCKSVCKTAKQLGVSEAQAEYSYSFSKELISHILDEMKEFSSEVDVGMVAHFLGVHFLAIASQGSRDREAYFDNTNKFTKHCSDDMSVEVEKAKKAREVLDFLNWLASIKNDGGGNGTVH